MSRGSDWSLLTLPTLALVLLILLFAAWDVVAPFLGITGARSEVGDQVLLTLVVLAGGVLAARIAFVAARRRIEEPADLYTFRKVVNLAAVAIVTAVVLAIWFRVAESLALSLGLVGAGLMLALAPVITGVAGWVHLVASRPYSVGDRVEVGGVRGDVVDIKLLHTILLEIGEEGFTGSVVQVPNRAVLQDEVVNDTKDFTFRWFTVELPVSYDSDWRKARDLFRGILVEKAGPAAVDAKERIRQLRGKYYLQKRDVAPVVSVTFDSNWILLRGRFVAPVIGSLAMRNEMQEAIIAALETHPDVQVGSESVTVALEDRRPPQARASGPPGPVGGDG